MISELLINNFFDMKMTKIYILVEAEQRGATILVLLDLSMAFHTIDHNILLGWLQDDGALLVVLSCSQLTFRVDSTKNPD